MFFAEELDDLINKYIEIQGRDNWIDAVISALELKLAAVREDAKYPDGK